MTGVSKRFGATRALVNVSLTTFAGQTHALIGENGAGKSTLMKILGGAIRPDAGAMQLAGIDYAPANPHEARKAGVAIVYQELNLAGELSVEDNIMLGQEERRFGLLRRSVQRERVRAALARLGRPELPLTQRVVGLSVGDQQIVEIARALVCQAKLIVFDEPTSSLARRDAERLFEIIRRLASEGIGVVYISHFLEEIRQVCQRFTVLRDGARVGEGAVRETSDRQIVGMMAGRSVAELFPKVEHSPGETLLAVSGLSNDVRRGAKIKGVSLELRRGEIMGLAGLVGAGRTELARAIFGLDRVREGRVRIAGRIVSGGPRATTRLGMGLVSEDRKGEGLAQSRSIGDNLTYSRLGPYSRFGWLNLPARRRAVDDWMRRVQIKARSGDQPVASLSGGNQQKVAIARVLHQDADLLLLDEPTRGIDVGVKSEIYRLIGDAAAAGKAVLFISSYLPELLAVCDRVGVMSRGSLVEVRPASGWTEEEILSAAIAGENE